jgi:hypothetical protein
MVGIFSGMVASFLAPRIAGAQFTEQEVRNGLQVTSTGNVDVEQAASGTQDVGVVINGELVTEDGVYQSGTSQVVLNDGQITSTGDVRVVQSASGTQTAVYSGVRNGGPVEGECRPGDVIANPDTGQLFYVARDCCYYEVPCCCECEDDACEGDFCG